MAPRYFKDGQDFEFPSSFGFRNTAPVNPRQHPTMSQDPFGDDKALAVASDAEPAMARGGSVKPRMPRAGGAPPKAAKAVLGALQLGKAIGQKEASAGAGAGPVTPMAAPPAVPPGLSGPPAPGGMPPAMRKGGTIKEATGGDVYDKIIEEKSGKPPMPHLARGGKTNFIKGAIKKPGQLHRDLGVPQGKKIPESKIRAAAKGHGKTAARARFAETLEGLRPGKKG